MVQTTSRKLWQGEMVGVLDGVLTLHIGDQAVCLPLTNVESVHDAHAASQGSIVRTQPR